MHGHPHREVLTLNIVADASNMRLMHDFYRMRGGAAGVPKAEALRRAQLSLLKGGAKSDAGDAERRGLAGMRLGATGYSHPYFWAPFILVGNWL